MGELRNARFLLMYTRLGMRFTGHAVQWEPASHRCNSGILQLLLVRPALTSMKRAEWG